MKLNEWDVTPKEAIEIQRQLRDRIRLTPLNKKIRAIAGCDVSMNLYSKTVYAGFVVFSYPELELMDHAVVKDEVTFPYVPGLLSFREIPSLIKAWEKLKTKSDLIMVDGQGIAHPRRTGIATHLGLVLDMPAIGCAKSVLFGSYAEPKKIGEASPLIDPKTGEIIGSVLRSKKNCKPLIISAGHNITQEESLAIVESCLKGYRLPEPTRQAHITVNQYRVKAGK